MVSAYIQSDKVTDVVCESLSSTMNSVYLISFSMVPILTHKIISYRIVTARVHAPSFILQTLGYRHYCSRFHGHMCVLSKLWIGLIVLAGNQSESK